MPPQPQGEFVRSVLAQLGMSQTELGVELRKPNAYATVHGWAEETKKLGYEDTMRMLELCGWLSRDAKAARGRQSTPDPLATLAATVVEQGKLLALIADSLGVPEPVSRTRSQPKAPPKRKRAAR